MRNSLLVALGLLLLTGVIFVGCSDDDDDGLTSSGPGVLGFATGTIYLDPEAYMSDLWIMGNNGQITPYIDSFKVGDSLVERDDIDYDYNYDYHDGYWEIYFSEDGDTTTYMWDDGDMGHVYVWGEGRSSTATVKLLDYDVDGINWITPDYNEDTLTDATTSTCIWNKCPNAEWYAVWVEVYRHENGENDWFYLWDYTYDTTYTVAGNVLGDSALYMYINVVPTSGPNPETGASNWTGNFCNGKLYGYADYDYTRIVVHGTFTEPGKVVPEKPRQELKPGEVLRKLTEQYK